jgi:hypothetical protein
VGPSWVIALYARAFDSPGFPLVALACSSVSPQQEHIRLNAELDAIWQVIRLRGCARLQEIERIVNWRRTDVDESAEE